MDQIIQYIKQKYNPLSVILYGSYANGTNDANSDFDALVISNGCELCHDTSFVGTTQLDVFVYPASYFDEDYDYSDFIQIFDGKVVMDTEDKGKQLRTSVQSYLHDRPKKTKMENQANIDWCTKMLERANRGDAEGLFRWHWVLTESLEIFCDITHHLYLGPKKSILWMKEQHPVAFACYETALSNFNYESLKNWISYIKDIHNQSME